MPGDSIIEYINSSRREFGDSSINKETLLNDPIEQFEKWMEESVIANLLDPYAMTLATVDASGMPDLRVVYLRDVIDSKLVFYTNHNSAKVKQISINNKASVNFLWNEFSRQVRIKGLTEIADASVSDKYFAARPRSSQIGAWASAQSDVIESREELIEKVKYYTDKFEGMDVPRPGHWGGVMLKPTYFEFWQGRDSRLHDRIIYQLFGDIWKISRLSP